ncbi:unnamed protein product [Phaedon cochleariae]|uniref:Retrotransposon gag domain-containing protein n=1 Tax=Phaedon cochleariae TaxID=80249 RepID=A0A9N9SGA9_PHACE|nr:unnamed protein product [Phaedon cochleariae]
MSFKGNLANSWEFFKQMFEIYLRAARLIGEDDSYKAVVLLNTVGDGVIKIYNNIQFETAEDKNVYWKIIEKLDEYFIPTKNVTYEWNVFFTRNMKADESIDEYVNELRRLSSTCEFSTLTDSLIKDRIVLGIQDRNLKDRLFRETNLTLKKAVELCKAAEQASKQLNEIVNSNVEVDAVRRTAPVPRDQRRSYQMRYHQKEMKTGARYCCGGDHPRDRNRCPARDVICNKCKNARECRLYILIKSTESINLITCNIQDGITVKNCNGEFLASCSVVF